MRRYLIDRARGRPSAQFEGLDELEDLTKPDWAQVVEIRYFLGLNNEQAAEALGWKLPTLQRLWSNARQWLSTGMEERSVPLCNRNQTMTNAS